MATTKRDPIEYHDVLLALGKAKAARLLLIAVTSDDDYLQIPAPLSAQAAGDTRDWIKVIAEEALEDALDEAEAAFRKAVPPDEARRQIVGAS